MILGQLFNELKRRNVIRVAIAYVVSAWLVLQVVDVVLNNIEAPAWVFSAFMLAGAVFFVPVLLFSWAYELTPEGVKRETEVERDRSITRQTGRKLDLITIGMLVAVVGFVLVEDRLFLGGTVDSASGDVAEEVVATAVDDKSIAVLAFDDMSPGGDQAFFAEGLSEEILNVLAQMPGLKVAGRTSSFAFKEQETDLREIGEALNVAHVLEGSVRKAGDRIRVTAQLIQTSDGFHLFSKTYDRDLTDVFAVQDEIAALIGTALKSELNDGEAIPSAMPTSLETYDLYLLARQRIHSRNPDLMSEALEMLDEALEIDPDYAPALAQRALVLSLMSDGPGAYGDIPAAVAEAEGLALIERALEIDPKLAEAHAIFGLIIYQMPGRLDEAIASLRYALELNPNMDDGKNWLANATPDFDEAVELYKQVLERDPLYGPAFNNLIQNYMDFADFDRSEELIARVARITGPDANVRQALGTVALMRGDLSGAVRDLGYAHEVNPNAEVVRGWLNFALFQVGDLQRASTFGTQVASMPVLAAMGDFDAVDQLIEQYGSLSGNPVFLVGNTAIYLVQRGQAARVVDIVNEHYGSVSGLLEMWPVDAYFGTIYLGPLALAYSLAGMDAEHQLLMDTMKSVLEKQQARGSDNWVQWVSRAQYSALAGDKDTAVDQLQTAFDKGFAVVEIANPVFDVLGDDERYVAIRSKIIARANQERVKLGMGPYEPPIVFD